MYESDIKMLEKEIPERYMVMDREVFRNNLARIAGSLKDMSEAQVRNIVSDPDTLIEEINKRILSAVIINPTILYTESREATLHDEP